MKRKWTDNDLINVVSNREIKSIAGVLRELGLAPKGGSYKTIQKHIERLKLDTSHFTGQSHLKGRCHNWAKKTPLKDILKKGLGPPLYELYVAGIAAETQKYENIRDGTTYTVTNKDGDTVTVRWNGLLNTDKDSLLAYFIFAQYAADQNSYNTSIGEQSANNQNSTLVFPESKIRQAYNRGVELYGQELNDADLKYMYFKSPRRRAAILEQLKSRTQDYYKDILKSNHPLVSFHHPACTY